MDDDDLDDPDDEEDDDCDEDDDSYLDSRENSCEYSDDRCSMESTATTTATLRRCWGDSTATPGGGCGSRHVSLTTTRDSLPRDWSRESSYARDLRPVYEIRETSSLRDDISRETSRARELSRGLSHVRDLSRESSNTHDFSRENSNVRDLSRENSFTRDISRENSFARDHFSEVNYMRDGSQENTNIHELHLTGTVMSDLPATSISFGQHVPRTGSPVLVADANGGSADDTIDCSTSQNIPLKSAPAEILNLSLSVAKEDNNPIDLSVKKMVASSINRENTISNMASLQPLSVSRPSFLPIGCKSSVPSSFALSTSMPLKSPLTPIKEQPSDILSPVTESSLLLKSIYNTTERVARVSKSMHENQQIACGSVQSRKKSGVMLNAYLTEKAIKDSNIKCQQYLTSDTSAASFKPVVTCDQSFNSEEGLPVRKQPIKVCKDIKDTRSKCPQYLTSDTSTASSKPVVTCHQNLHLKEGLPVRLETIKVGKDIRDTFTKFYKFLSSGTPTSFSEPVVTRDQEVHQKDGLPVTKAPFEVSIDTITPSDERNIKRPKSPVTDENKIISGPGLLKPKSYLWGKWHESKNSQIPETDKISASASNVDDSLTTSNVASNISFRTLGADQEIIKTSSTVSHELFKTDKLISDPKANISSGNYLPLSSNMSAVYHKNITPLILHQNQENFSRQKELMKTATTMSATATNCGAKTSLASSPEPCRDKYSETLQPTPKMTLVMKTSCGTTTATSSAQSVDDNNSIITERTAPEEVVKQRHLYDNESPSSTVSSTSKLLASTTVASTIPTHMNQDSINNNGSEIYKITSHSKNNTATITNINPSSTISLTNTRNSGLHSISNNTTATKTDVNIKHEQKSLESSTKENSSTPKSVSSSATTSNNILSSLGSSITIAKLTSKSSSLLGATSSIGTHVSGRSSSGVSSAMNLTVLNTSDSKSGVSFLSPSGVVPTSTSR